MSDRPGNLVEFLLARIGEDEQIAHRAGGRTWMTGSQTQGRIDPYSSADGLVTIEGSHVCLAERPTPTDQDGQVCTVLPFDTRRSFHIANFDPARVLAECESKRQLLRHVTLADIGYGPMVKALQLLALPYADHPQFQEAWRS